MLFLYHVVSPVPRIHKLPLLSVLCYFSCITYTLISSLPFQVVASYVYIHKHVNTNNNFMKITLFLVKSHLFERPRLAYTLLYF